MALYRHGLARNMARAAVVFLAVIGLVSLPRMLLNCAPEAQSQVGNQPPRVECGLVQVALQDGSTLGARLTALEQTLVKSQEAVIQEMKKTVSQQRLIDMESMPSPLRLLDFSRAGKLAVKGPEDALVTIVEFSDFQCPYCARMGLALLELWKTHPDQIRIVFVDRPLVSPHRDGYPFHPYAMIAHEAAAEARAQGKFWEMYEYIFSRQNELFPGRPRSQEDYEAGQRELREKLIAAAAELKMDRNKMRTALENRTHKPRLDKTNALAASLGVNSTPTVWANAYFDLRNPALVDSMIKTQTANLE